MRPIYLIVMAVGLLCCGCQGTGPAKIDNPVVGPPPPRLPPEKIREKQLAYAGQSDDSPEAVASSTARARLDDRPSSSGIQRVSLTSGNDKDLPTFDDGMVVAMVNDQPIFAGEVLAPMRKNLKLAEAQMKQEYGKAYKPEMMNRLRAMYIKGALPRIVEQKMLVVAAKAAFKKNQMEGMMRVVEKEWGSHLEQMMQHNKCTSVAELETLLAENDYDLEDHEANFKDRQIAMNYVGFRSHSKFEPTRKEMLKYYEEHLADYEFPARVHWQQLVISDSVHGGEAGARKRVDLVVKELVDGADFTATIKKYGDGPKAKAGGKWDWTVKGSLQNKDIENELFTLPVGEMSGVIRTSSGFQIVQVIDRQEAGRKTFESQQKAIEGKIKEEAYHLRAKDVIAEVREASIIKTIFDGDDPKARPSEKPAAETNAESSEKAAFE